MKKIIIKVILFTILVVAIMPLTAKAGFQANKGGTSYTVTTTIYANHLFIGARQMETKGGTLGKEAILATITYLDTTEGGNGIDCHMAKNTEWGTAAMLSASDYGNAPSGNDTTKSTTQNESGIYQMAGSTSSGSSKRGTELVAGIWTKQTGNTYIGTIAKADSRYYDLYTSEVSKPGDATTETAGWKGSSGATFVNASYPIFQRSYNGLFGYYYHDGHQLSFDSGCYAGARAVAVCGDGL